MFKKVLIASCLLAASTTIAVAGPVYKDEGAKFKDAVASAPCVATEFGTGPYVGLSFGPRLNYSSNPAVYKGLEANLSLGYSGLITPMFYLAGELFGANSAELRNYQSSTGNNLKSTWSFGASLIPGVMLTDNLVGFIRLGGDRIRFSQIKTYSTGWHAGIGLQANLVQNWDIRGEYIYNQYGKASIAVKNPYAEQYNFGIVYKFM